MPRKLDLPKLAARYVNRLLKAARESVKTAQLLKRITDANFAGDTIDLPNGQTFVVPADKPKD